jgi:hypothetical protein
MPRGLNVLARVVAGPTLLLSLPEYESNNEMRVKGPTQTDPHCCESVSGHGILSLLILSSLVRVVA